MPPSSPVRFGNFEVDLRAGELRKQGRKIKLQEQPSQILALLLERPLEIVTREELRQKLWPVDTFVDFDHGLNSAIARLREALSDSAERPKYIETVPRRGYRFVGTLKAVLEGEAAPKEAATSENGQARLAASPRADVRPARFRRWLPAMGGASLFAIACGLYLLRHPVRSQAVTREIDSVAVLPFENSAPGAETDFLADGITQSAIDHLSRLGNLKVISMGSASRYRGKHEDPRQIGRDLGVRSVMVGRITFRGDRMLVLAELIDARDGTHIWSEQYDRKVSDLVSVQDDIAQEIATRLGVRLSAQQQRLLRTPPIADFEAYQIYLRGRFYWNQRSQQDLQRGIAYFQQAIDRDPSNALAYAGLADSYFVRAISGAVPTKETMPKAKAAALKSLELDDSLAEAHTSLAQITANYDWDWSKAESEYKRAIDLNPNYSTGHHYYATFLIAMGKPQQAFEEMRRAQELDPLSPVIATFIGKLYFYAGKNDEAIHQYRKVLEADPFFPIARTFLITSLEQAGEFQPAIEELKVESAQLGRRPDQAAARERAYKKAGAEGYWRECLIQRGGGPNLGPGSDLDTAAIYARLGEKDEVFYLLNQAYEQRNMWLMNLKVDPRFDGLRSDPRYVGLLQRIGLN